MTNAEFARRIGAFIDELGLQHVHVAGTSLGGHVALLLAAAGKADAAVAFSPTGFWNKRQSLYTRTLVRVSRFGTFLSAPVVPALAATVFGRNLLLGTSFANPAGVPSEDAHAVVTDLRTSAGFAGFAQANSERLGGQPVSTSEAASRPDAGLRDALAKVPVTIAWAEQDRFLSPRQAEVARLALPHARHTTLPNCGHLATWDDPALLTELILTADFANHESH
ncbi:hypothetical protein JMUB6875_21200 [Nocardia sp. JMUB6875]